jgi:hypothetical protein
MSFLLFSHVLTYVDKNNFTNMLLFVAQNWVWKSVYQQAGGNVQGSISCFYYDDISSLILFCEPV